MSSLAFSLLPAGVEWEQVRDKAAPPWLPKPEAEEEPGLNWELTSLLAALPLRVDPPPDT